MTYSNGRIPSSALVRIPDRHRSPWAEGAIWLTPDAARDFLLLARDFERKFGTVLRITWGYRTLAVQQRMWEESPSTSAPPGTSPHGWARAMDVQSDPRPGYVYGASDRDTPEGQWLAAHAREYGFEPLSWEDWHYNYVGGATVTGDYEEIIETEETVTLIINVQAGGEYRDGRWSLSPGLALPLTGEDADKAASEINPGGDIVRIENAGKVKALFRAYGVPVSVAKSRKPFDRARNLLKANRALIKQANDLDDSDLDELAVLIASQIVESLSGEPLPTGTEIAAAVSAALLPALSSIPEDMVDALGERLG